MTRPDPSAIASLPWAPAAQAAARLAEGWDPWAAWAEASPQALALESAEGEGTTFLEAHRLACRGAAALVGAGLQPGQAVALWGPQGRDWWIALWAIWRAGAIALPLHSRWVDAEVRALLERAGAAWSWVPEAARERAQAWGPPALTWPEDSKGLDEGPSSAEVPFGGARWGEAAALWIATSGSSGPPKLAHLSTQALLASARAWNEALGVGPGDRWWLGLGGYHVGGLGVALRQGLAGGACVLGAQHFEPSAARRQWVGCDWVSAVPLQAAEVLAAPGPSLPGRIRRLVVGGQAAGPGLLGALGPLAVASYGLTESASGLCLAQPTDPPGCAGRPLPGVRVRVLAPPGGLGPILASGPMLMAHYVGDAQASALALDAEGWLHTQDVGRLDEEGRLWVAGRAEGVIVTGGEKVHPGELEAALLAHPGVAEAVVVPVPDPRYGQRPLAFWRALGAQGPSEAELLAHLGDRLAGYKRPKALWRRQDFPRLAGGKVDRQALKALAEAGGPA